MHNIIEARTGAETVFTEVNKGEQNTLNGVLLYDDMPVATVKDGEVFLHATGEKVAFIGGGELRGRKSELLGSVEALLKGQTLSRGKRSF